MKYKNMKISITDETHLQAVCDVLGKLGYTQVDSTRNADTIVTYSSGSYVLSKNTMSGFRGYTLTDLLKMRDEMVKEGLK